MKRMLSSFAMKEKHRSKKVKTKQRVNQRRRKAFSRLIKSQQNS